MKGLLFTPEMARAACKGRKTITRRVIAPKPPERWSPTVGKYSPTFEDNRTGEPFPGQEVFGAYDEEFSVKCDYVPGERRCLLTTWAVSREIDHLKPTELPVATITMSDRMLWHAGMVVEKPELAGKSRPGRFLPNSLRHLMPIFEIGSVRAERVQDITEEDAMAEGLDVAEGENYVVSAREQFEGLWDSINADRKDAEGNRLPYAWADNPWVWRVEFKRIT